MENIYGVSLSSAIKNRIHIFFDLQNKSTLYRVLKLFFIIIFTIPFFVTSFCEFLILAIFSITGKIIVGILNLLYLLPISFLIGTIWGFLYYILNKFFQFILIIQTLPNYLFAEQTYNDTTHDDEKNKYYNYKEFIKILSDKIKTIINDFYANTKPSIIYPLNNELLYNNLFIPYKMTLIQIYSNASKEDKHKLNNSILKQDIEKGLFAYSKLQQIIIEIFQTNNFNGETCYLYGSLLPHAIEVRDLYLYMIKQANNLNLINQEDLDNAILMLSKTINNSKNMS